MGKILQYKKVILSIILISIFSVGIIGIANVKGAATWWWEYASGSTRSVGSAASHGRTFQSKLVAQWYPGSAVSYGPLKKSGQGHKSVTGRLSGQVHYGYVIVY